MTRGFASSGEPELGCKWHQPHTGNCSTSCQKSRNPDFWYRSNTEKSKCGAGGSPEQVLVCFVSCIFAISPSPDYLQNATSPARKTESAAHPTVSKTKFKRLSSLEKYGTCSGCVFLARIGAILDPENREIRELELCTKVDRPRNEKILQDVRKLRRSPAGRNPDARSTRSDGRNRRRISLKGTHEKGTRASARVPFFCPASVRCGARV